MSLRCEMRNVTWIVSILLLLPLHAMAHEAPEVPCGDLHFRIAGDEFSSKCRAIERQDEGARWRQESISARNGVGAFIVIRSTAITAPARMAQISRRRVAEAWGLHEIEDWSSEMRIAGYRAHSFTGISGGGSRLRCLSFAKNTSATSGLRARVLGVYCTALANPLDETVAADLLQRIQVQ